MTLPDHRAVRPRGATPIATTERADGPQGSPRDADAVLVATGVAAARRHSADVNRAVEPLLRAAMATLVRRGIDPAAPGRRWPRRRGRPPERRGWTLDLAPVVDAVLAIDREHEQWSLHGTGGGRPRWRPLGPSPSPLPGFRIDESAGSFVELDLDGIGRPVLVRCARTTGFLEQRLPLGARQRELWRIGTAVDSPVRVVESEARGYGSELVVREIPLDGISLHEALVAGIRAQQPRPDRRHRRRRPAPPPPGDRRR
ncbi:hypothetical protein [Patulibacter defluvii]|uniref:hypothetical protein n=1 Tax=Patulibacter defluvii TaxID=3095358 RepID=UPI002A7586C7|nr:hypothetical protein [Patulibacter sp. DM4]